ncbi:MULTISPECIES: sigma-54-dependent transcriptional regulator [Marinobacter]|uniref:AAA family ATPase n=1 Tax=Marinobacter profundi TaxID=2666256 RepID=A0A2G1UI85_9GAMM|nr:MULTISPECIES: sigma 54-interacting transcriptional regulator [Marinobacter]MBD3658034.1 sigma-54-dependent Fis family transcriptional regulator [Marinobacter sp.]PHQ14187.1 AAA family ATPase [Marinobacter profundi]
MKTIRPLLWLSPGPSDRTLPDRFLPHWNLLRFNFCEHPPANLGGLPATRVGILDLSELPDGGAPFLEEWIEVLSPTLWIGVLDPQHRGIDEAEAMVALHCTDFHTRPLDPARLNTVLGHLWGMADLQRRLATPGATDTLPYALAGQSPAIQAARSLLERFAMTADPVIIEGESGTGKDAAAHFVHDSSPLRHGPFITANCAALPVAQTESGLFGATGTFQDQLRAAEGGSLVLTGVDELLPAQQSLLLHLLDGQTTTRADGTPATGRPARLIVTCRTPLHTLVEQKQFREDVFYRLGGLEVMMPTLRERLEDLPLLVDRILRNMHSSTGASHKHLSEQAMQWMFEHDWPGNLRELRNRLRQAILLSDKPTIGPELLGFHGLLNSSNQGSGLSLEQFRARAEQQAVMCSLALTHQNVSAAARLLDISRVSFYRLMAKHGTSAHSPTARHNPP